MASDAADVEPDYDTQSEGSEEDVEHVSPRRAPPRGPRRTGHAFGSDDEHLDRDLRRATRWAMSLPHRILLPNFNFYRATIRQFVVREQCSRDPAQPTFQGIVATRGTEQGSYLWGSVSSLATAFVYRTMFNSIAKGVLSFHTWLDPVRYSELYKFLKADEEQYTVHRRRQRSKVTLARRSAQTDEDSDEELEKEFRSLNDALLMPTHSKVRASVKWTSIIGATCITAALQHPYSVVSTWQMNQIIVSVSSEPTVCEPGTFIECWRALQSQGKSVWAGLDAHICSSIVQTVLHGLVIEPLLRRVLGWEVNDKQLDRELDEALDQDSPNFGPDRVLVLLFRRISKATALSMLSNWLAYALVFPLTTIRYRLESQGANFALQGDSTSALECYNEIREKEGLAGFYKGFGAHMFSVLPNMGALLVTYLFFQSLLTIAFGDRKRRRVQRG